MLHCSLRSAENSSAHSSSSNACPQFVFRLPERGQFRVSLAPAATLAPRELLNFVNTRNQVPVADVADSMHALNVLMLHGLALGHESNRTSWCFPSGHALGPLLSGASSLSKFQQLIPRDRLAAART